MQEQAEAARRKSAFAAQWALGPELDTSSQPATAASAPAHAPADSASYSGGWETAVIAGNQLQLPSDLLSLENIHSVLTPNIWAALDPSDRASLKQYLPGGSDLSDADASAIVEQLLSGKLRNLGVSQVEEFSKELAEGAFNSEVVKYAEVMERHKKMKRLQFLKRHNMQMIRRVIDSAQRYGRNVESDLRELDQLQALFKEEDKRRQRILAAEDAARSQSEMVADEAQISTGRGRKPASTKLRGRGMIPPDLSAYADDDLDEQVSREAYQTFAPRQVYTAASSSLDAAQEASSEISMDVTPTKSIVPVMKKRKREELADSGTLEAFMPQSADLVGTSSADASQVTPKAKRPRVSSRKDQKAANASIALPIDAFSLFKTIYRSLLAAAPQSLSLENLTEAVSAEPRIAIPKPGQLSLQSLVKLAISYLTNPFTPISTDSCPKILTVVGENAFSFLPQQEGTPDVQSVVISRLERFEPVFWFAISRGHFDSVKCELFAAPVNKLLTGRAPATITRGPNEVQHYQEQEQHRYALADKGFEYVITLNDGSVKHKAVVSPCRAQRGRESSFIKTDRPPCVTVSTTYFHLPLFLLLRVSLNSSPSQILTIVRDALARLPAGVGIRQDIAVLSRDTQYLNDEPGAFTEQQYAQVVSNALDRLQADVDSCVKYDNELKIWIYLHRQRTVSDFDNYWSRVKALEEDAAKQTSAGMDSASTNHTAV